MPWRHKSYEVLPALSVRKSELRRSLRLVTAAWGFGILWMTCISGSWMNTFQRLLGFDNRHFGLMRSLMYVASFANLAATILVERSGLKKYQFIFFVAAARLLWLVVAAIVLLLSGTAVAPWLVLAVVLGSWILSALGMPAWFTWMGDLIPRRIRGRFLARRGQITRLIQFPFAITLAILMDRAILDKLPVTPEAQPHLLWVFAGLFAAAAVFGFADIMLFRGIRDIRPTTRSELPRPAVEIAVPPPKHGGLRGHTRQARRYLHGLAHQVFLGSPTDRGFWSNILDGGRAAFDNYVVHYVAEVIRQLVLGPLKERAFRRYVLFGATASFAMAVGGPFYIRNMRENLGFSHLALNFLFMVCGPLVTIVAVKQWGKLMDRWGRRPTLMLAMGLAVFGVAPYFFASKYTPNPAFVSRGVNAVSGAVGYLGGRLGLPVDAQWQLLPPGAPVGAWLICSTTIFLGFAGWTGVMLGQQGIILGFAESAGRSKYVAAHAVLCGMGGMFGAVAGGLVAEGVYRASWYHPVRIGLFEWNHWHVTFAISALCRVLAFCWLIGMPDPGARRARDMVRTIWVEAYNVVAAKLYHDWRNYFRARRERRRWWRKRSRL